MKLLLDKREIDLTIQNRLGNLSYEAHAEVYGNDEIANMVE